ncbi:Fungal specific transcription factor domain [Ceratobasidium sp. AG-Ba]|nr:Fungal specific transcription factor domain [Ceratobasidium sp. AG-Ba]
MPDWRSIEQELHEWKPFTRTALEEESWRGVVRLAVQESWRHTLLIYLYMGVCGVASDDPRVRASVKQVFQIIGAVKKESDPIANIHFANQYLIAGAYTPSEKRRAIVREELSKLIKTGMWLLSGSDFIPVLDHLWHNAGCNGQPVTWRDYVHSRQIALPVPK